MVGSGMLWVGWYGFNAGSAVASDGIAANAFTTTTLATAVAAAVWPLLEWVTRGKPTILGFCSGAVAGLVVITPGAGFVTPSSAMLIGVLAGVVPFFACTKLKSFFNYDDALDTFGVHGVGGTMGALVTGFFANPEVNSNLSTNLSGIVGKTLWLEQLKAMGLTVAIALAGTAILAYAVKALFGLRPSLEDEELGLDEADHGEAGYHPEEGGVHGVSIASSGSVSALPARAPAAE
jgi:Amt family ammonium transporter